MSIEEPESVQETPVRKLAPVPDVAGDVRQELATTFSTRETASLRIRDVDVGNACAAAPLHLSPEGRLDWLYEEGGYRGPVTRTILEALGVGAVDVLPLVRKYGVLEVVLPAGNVQDLEDEYCGTTANLVFTADQLGE